MATESHPNWTGGSWVSVEGRTYIRVPDDECHLHPTIRPDKYIRRYHYVWNINHPDDPVMRGDIVHHVNHDKTDDRIDNLKKWRQSEHAKHHGTGKLHTPESRALMSKVQKERRQRERDARASAA